jgi:hypothetical protein
MGASRCLGELGGVIGGRIFGSQACKKHGTLRSFAGF